MIFTLIFLFLSLGISTCIFYFFRLYEVWYFFWVPLLLIPILYLLLFAIYILLVFLVSLCLNKKKKVTRPKAFWYFWIRQTAIQLLFLSRTRIKVEGKELLEAKNPYLVVSNHISMFDPMLAITKLGLDPLMCVTKKENLCIPICGAFIHHAGFISLDRESPASAISMVRMATAYLNDFHTSVYICPEGTRSKTGKLLPFHPGSFKIATRAEVDIVVCYIENTNLIAKHFPFHKTKVRIKVVDILKKEEIKNLRTNEISAIVYNILEKEQEKNNELFII